MVYILNDFTSMWIIPFMNLIVADIFKDLSTLNWAYEEKCGSNFFSAWLSTKCQKRTHYFFRTLTIVIKVLKCKMNLKYAVMLNSVLNFYIYKQTRRNSMFQFRNVNIWIFKCTLLRGIKFRLVIITSCFFPNDFIRHPWVTSWLHVDVWNRWIIFFVISFFRSHNRMII